MSENLGVIEYKTINQRLFDDILFGRVKEFIKSKDDLDKIGYGHLEKAIVVANIKVVASINISDQYQFPIIFLSGEFGEIKIRGGQIIILGGVFNAPFIFNYNVEKEILIKGGEFKQGITVTESANFNSDFNIEGSAIVNSFLIERGSFQKNFNIKGEKIIFEKFSIVGGAFYEKVSINGGVFKQDFTITQGVFKKGIEVSGGNFKGVFKLSVKDFSSDFFISGGTFENQFNIIDAHFKSKVEISGGEFKRGFSLYNSNFNKGFVIVGGNFNDSFVISGGSFSEEFRISNQPHFQKFLIQAGSFNSFWIAGGIFKDDFYVIKGSFGLFQTAGGVFKKIFRIVEGSFQELATAGGIFEFAFQIWDGSFKKVSIAGGIFEQSFKISGGAFEKFSVLSGEILQLFHIENGIFQEIHFAFVKLRINCLLFKSSISAKSIFIEFADNNSGSELKYLLFRDIDLPSTQIVKVKNVHLCNLYFSGFTNFSNIVFNGLRFKKASDFLILEDEKLNFKELTKENFDFLLPNDVTPKPNTFHILNSDLGKTTFINCNLEEMKLDFQSSKITDVFLAGSFLPKRIITEDNRQKQLGYAQLKKVYENRGDFVNAKEYFAREMNTYHDGLHWFRNFGEWINLLFNRISSNHGQSWILGTISTLATAIILFSIYCNYVGYSLAWNLEEDSWINFKYCAARFFEFINPVHKIDFFTGDEKILSNKARFLDGFSRIFLAYFIYQLIQAFRKHGKK